VIGSYLLFVRQVAIFLSVKPLRIFAGKPFAWSVFSLIGQGTAVTSTARHLKKATCRPAWSDKPLYHVEMIINYRLNTVLYVICHSSLRASFNVVHNSSKIKGLVFWNNFSSLFLPHSKLPVSHTFMLDETCSLLTPALGADSTKYFRKLFSNQLLNVSWNVLVTPSSWWSACESPYNFTYSR